MRSTFLLLISALYCLKAEAEPAPPPVEPSTLPAPDQKVEPVKPAVEKLDATHYRIGEVTFDQTTREIRIPAEVNMTEGLLEFLLVHKDGKVHESLFRTNINATHLNVAFTLLRYKASRELYTVYNDKGQNIGPVNQVPDEVKAAARVNIKVEWNDDGQTKSCPVNEWISDSVTEKPMPSGPWVYGGSEIEEGRFAPESTGDIVAIFLTNSAMILYPGNDNQNDEVWLPFPKRVPPIDTKVTLIFSPNTPNKPVSKP